jgi:hypothetical protein
MRHSVQAGEKGPHQPFGQLLQRRSDWLRNLLLCLRVWGGAATSRFSFGEAARRADEVFMPAVLS